jgi:hypothetical protein
MEVIDVAPARRPLPLVKESFAANLTEAATRFAISHSMTRTILVGVAAPSNSRRRSLLFKTVHSHPRHSTACQTCNLATDLRWRATLKAAG